MPSWVHWIVFCLSLVGLITGVKAGITPVIVAASIGLGFYIGLVLTVVYLGQNYVLHRKEPS